MLRQAKAEHTASPREVSTAETGSETGSVVETRRNSTQTTRLLSQTGAGKSKVAFTSGGSVGDDDEATNWGSYEPSFIGDMTKVPSQPADADDEEEYGEGSSDREAPVSKDAFDITAQSAKLQLEMMGHVNAALQAEQSRNPSLPISDSVAIQAVQAYDSSIRNLKGLVGDLLKISKDRDAYWQYRLEREADMRRMWEESMAQVAKEQEVLEARVGESEVKRKLTKRALREVIESSGTIVSRPHSRGEALQEQESTQALEQISVDSDGTALRRRSTVGSSLRRKSILQEVTNLSDSDSEDDEEFFDAVDAGEVAVALTMPTSPVLNKEIPKANVAEVDGLYLSASFKGYEDGIRKRLKMDADDRPKISLWVRDLIVCLPPAHPYSRVS